MDVCRRSLLSNECDDDADDKSSDSIHLITKAKCRDYSALCRANEELSRVPSCESSVSDVELLSKPRQRGFDVLWQPRDQTLTRKKKKPPPPAVLSLSQQQQQPQQQQSEFSRHQQQSHPQLKQQQQQQQYVIAETELEVAAEAAEEKQQHRHPATAAATQQEAIASPLLQQQQFFKPQQQVKTHQQFRPHQQHLSPIQPKPQHLSPIQQKPLHLSPLQPKPEYLSPIQSKQQHISLIQPKERHPEEFVPRAVNFQQQKPSVRLRKISPPFEIHLQETEQLPIKERLRREIAASASKRQLMRQVSGLGMEDPVYGTRERGPSHASQIYDDMSVGDVAEDMKDVVSVASDHTATEGDGLDVGAFHASLMTIPTDISLETNNRHYSSFNAITDIRPGSPSSCLRFQSTTKAQKRPSLSSSRASNKTEPVPAQKNVAQWDPSHRTSARSEIPSRPHATYIRRRNETMVEREIPLISLSLSDQQNVFSERRTKMLPRPESLFVQEEQGEEEELEEDQAEVTTRQRPEHHRNNQAAESPLSSSTESRTLAKEVQGKNLWLPEVMPSTSPPANGRRGVLSFFPRPYMQRSKEQHSQRNNPCGEIQ